jgi:hypothetical protein
MNFGPKALEDFVQRSVFEVQNAFPEEEKSKPVLIRFADFGDDYFIIQRFVNHLERWIEGKGSRMIDDDLTQTSSTQTLPQSSTYFDILYNAEGLVLRNSSDKGNQVYGEIAIPLASFSDLMKALFLQSGRALGRTAPHTHYKLLEITGRILAGESVNDLGRDLNRR